MRRVVPIEDGELARTVLGPRDSHLRRVREALGVTAVLRGGKVLLDGPERDVELAASALVELRRTAELSGRVTREDVERALSLPAEREPGRAASLEVLLVGRGKEVRPRTHGQEEYVRLMRNHDIVFCIGPAGTGKTYLAVAMALAELEAGRVNRICLARPAVEAGERLGFLPGDERQKVNPYLRPLYDALQDMMSYPALERLLEQGAVEIVPLAYMRGRTLGRAFVILDEAQNTTSTQMLMFLTRLGLDSRAVVTGDVTQIDLPEPSESGLVEARRILAGVDGIAFAELRERDIVRHRLVRAIVEAYEADRKRADSLRPNQAGGAHWQAPRARPPGDGAPASRNHEASAGEVRENPVPRAEAGSSDSQGA